MNLDPASERCGRWRPWRSARLGWAATGAIVLAGLPLFLRMPLWCDATLYDVAAREVLHGGVHYRDVFDTNTPGYLWVLCGVRAAFGPGSEVLRAVDLAIVIAISSLLLGWARLAGASKAAIAWSAAGIAGFYLFISESNHCQRDTWMMLPAVTAAWLRLRRANRGLTETQSNRSVFRSCLLEGMIWGLSVWIKPHILLVAVIFWLVAQGGAGCWRRRLADLAGSLLGGLVVGVAGVAWLVVSGTWPYFLDVFTHWNAAYLQNVFGQLNERFDRQLLYFPPWSLLCVLAVPLAILNLITGSVIATTEANNVQPRSIEGYARALLASHYLGWAATALFFQKPYHYVHVPETLLMLALFAANRWVIALPLLLLEFGMMVGLAMAGESLTRWVDQPLVVRHIARQYPDPPSNRFRWWLESLHSDVPRELRDGVAFESDFFAGTNTQELGEVEDYLRAVGVNDGELICWHDSPHRLYLSLNLRPPIRFMHLSTATEMGDEQYERVKQEVTAALATGRVRYVVSDLKRVAHLAPQRDNTRMNEPAPDLIPPVVPANCRAVFPLNQRAIFRSKGGRGRYVVHVIERPIGEIYVPYWQGQE